jgi:hypothetical protein
MPPRALWMLVLLAALALPAGAGPPTAQDWRDYSGTLDGRIPIRMSLWIQGERRLSGSYFHVKSPKDIPLQGQIATDRTVVLHEYDGAGHEQGIFRGQFLNQDTLGRKLGFEQLMGSWSKPDGSGAVLFHLVQSSSQLRRPGENRYAVAGIHDDVAVESFAQRFLAAVRARDRRAIADLIHLPIVVRIAGWPIKVRHREVLLARYEAIFQPDFCRALSSAVPHDMFARDVGVMLGEHGEVWIGDRDGQLKVIAINN